MYIVAKLLAKIIKQDGFILISPSNEKFVIGNPLKKEPMEVKILKKNPRYDVAFYFKCNLNTASLRRWLDLKKKVPLEEVKKSLRTRTLLDKKRRHNPLKKMSDAVLIRTSILSKKAMVTKMSEEIDKKLISKYGRNFKAR